MVLGAGTGTGTGWFNGRSLQARTHDRLLKGSRLKAHASNALGILSECHEVNDIMLHSFVEYLFWSQIFKHNTGYNFASKRFWVLLVS